MEYNMKPKTVEIENITITPEISLMPHSLSPPTHTLTRGNALIYFHRLVLPVLELNVSGIIHYILSSVRRPISFSIIFLRFTDIIVCISSLFHFIVVFHCINMQYILFYINVNHPSQINLCLWCEAGIEFHYFSCG